MLLPLLLAGALLVGLAACSDDADDAGSPDTTPAAETTTSSTAAATSDPSTTSPTPDEGEVRAYFLRGEEVGPVARPAEGAGVAAAALEGLLAGPTPAEQELGFTTAIPAGTELLGVSVEGGVATVDLSDEFGSGGGSASMTARVAQVVFTATQFPTVEAVAFRMAGQPIEALGGEGMILTQPQTRADWEASSPAILVESPLPLAEVTSPLRISGTANVFEAQFQINVVDGEGLIVYDQPVMATSGTGTRGTFDVTATFEAPRPGRGAVIVFASSPRDGSQIDLVEVPLRIS